MTDDELLSGIENCTLPETYFGHEGHVRLGFVYLQRLPFLDAAVQMATTLRRYAASLNKFGRYHETITLGFLALIYERLGRFEGSDWEAFRCAYPELLEKEALLAYYPRELLMSDRARKGFVLPPRDGDPFPS